jgi:hypothetical protein
MFEAFTTSEEIFSYKLGSALTMEYDSLEMLGELERPLRETSLRLCSRNTPMKLASRSATSNGASSCPARCESR